MKYCYEQELTKKPELGGRIMVQFTIAASGQVIASVLQNSTMGNPRVENCTVQAVRRWEFPKPLGGGIVIVTYPFQFRSEGFGKKFLSPLGFVINVAAFGSCPGRMPMPRTSKLAMA